MGGLTNKELEDLCKFFFKENFLGVYPCDVLPNKNFEKFSVIFNLSKHYENGSHFISVTGNKRKIIYFDSFGEPCDNEHILKYMKSFKKPIKVSKQQLQSVHSNFCGLYCLYFLIRCFLKNESLKNFLNHFGIKSLMKNDKLLLKYILKEIKVIV